MMENFLSMEIALSMSELLFIVTSMKFLGLLIGVIALRPR